MDDSLEVVYYSGQVPRDYSMLTFLALVFDKIYFPGVYLSHEGVDEQETIKEIKRIENLESARIDTGRMLNCMILSLNYKYIKDFCVFTGKEDEPFRLEEGTKEMAYAIEELIYGPPPPNFTPMIDNGFLKSLPGGGVVHAPSWLTYPANAFIYSMKNSIPLINDNPNMPIPALEEPSPENNAKILSTILSIESVKLVMPRIPTLNPEQISEFRYETTELIKPFRLSMLSLSKDLNLMLKADMNMEEVRKAAQFLVETTVYPKIEELRIFIENPKRPWYRRFLDLATSTPELGANFLIFPPNIAVAKVLAKVAHELMDINYDKLEKKEKMKSSGFYYLLRISQDLPKHEN